MQLTNPVWKNSSALKRLFDALEGKARFIGGGVRDQIIGKIPADLDAASPFTPAEALERLSDFTVIPTGIDFGTLTVLTADPRFPTLELTTLRRDVIPDGRRAKVAFTTDWEADALRRDFTFNALSADFDGTVHDPCGGIADLTAGRVRFIGSPAQRIAEDYLRILRYFRFFAAFSAFPADPDVLTACRDGKSGLVKVSPERAAVEFSKLFRLPRAIAGLNAAAETGVLPLYFPFADLSRWPETLPREAVGWLAAGKGPLSAFLPRPLKAEIAALNRMETASPFERAVLCAESGKAADFRASLSAAGLPVEDIDPPVFPLSGKDLLFLPPPRIGQALKSARALWLAKRGTPDKTELLSFIADQTCSDQSNLRNG